MKMLYLLIPMTQALPLEYFISEGPLQRISPPVQQLEWLEMVAAVPLQEQPVLPIIPWALRFDEDLMIALDDPDWGMIEVCRVDTPTGPIWFSLDSYPDGRQLVGIADRDVDRSFAQSFPAELYINDIEVTETPTERGTEFEVFYRRKDREIIAFSLETEDPDRPPRKRNGNAMNHSADQSLAVLDIFSLDLSSKSLDWTDQPQPVFDILGKPVVARMRQSVGGIHNGQWRQIEDMLRSNSSDVKLEHIPTPDGLIVQTDSFPQLRYHFRAQQSQLRLHQITVQQPHPNRQAEVFRIDFEPPLPDLRYGPPQETFQAQALMSLNAQPTYAAANITIENINGSSHILLEPSQPSWASERPVSIIHHPTPQGFESHAWVLTHSSNNRHQFQLSDLDQFFPEHLLEHQLMIWEKNPHRLSKLSVSPESADLKGGTWANGDRAKDRIFLTQRTQAVPANSLFYHVPQVALIQNRAKTGTPLEAQIQVHLPIHPQIDEQIVPFIHAVHLDSGPFHTHDGMTIGGLNIEIQNIQHDAQGMIIDLYAKIPFGSVPDRKQDLDHYSAFLQIDIGIARNPPETKLQRSHFSDIRTIPPSRKFGRLSPLPVPENSSRGWLQAWSFEVLDEGPHQGRYIRGLAISSSTEIQHDKLIMTAKWSRETSYRISKTVVHPIPQE